MAKVSLLITVYNEIQFIRKTLESVIGEADEIIIGDNASTDGTSEICQEFALKYPEVKYTRHKEDMGCSYNAFFILRQATGQYIRWIGGHDMFSRGSTKNMMDIMEKNPDVVMVYPKNIVILNCDYTVADFVKIDQYGNDILSDSPFVRVESMMRYYYYDSIFFALYKADVLECMFKYIVFQNIVNSNWGIFAARYGKIIGDDSVSSVFYRMIPGSFRKTDASLQGEGLRIYGKAVDPCAYGFATLCAHYALVQEMQAMPGAPPEFEKKMLDYLILECKFYSIPNLSNMPGLLPQKKDYAEHVLKLVLKKIGKSPKAPWEKKNYFKKFLMAILPYGIIRPQSILRLQTPRQPYFLFSNLFRLKWLLPYGLVCLAEKHCPAKQEHESASLYGGKWW
jgi:glycosyltransferase involved in cell wall biosynthesis